MEEPIDIAPLFCVYGSLVIPHRYVLMAMLHLSLLHTVTLRSSLAVVLTNVHQFNYTSVEDSCPEYNFVEEIEHRIFKWPSWVLNYTIYAFSLGYLLSHIPGGILADKFGGRHVLGISVLLSTILNFFIPLILQYGSEKAPIFIHLANGLLQGPICPAIASILQHWAPLSERGFIGGISYGGREFGVFLINMCSGYITTSVRHWATPFYVFGIFTILWYVLSLFFIFSAPSTHPFINDEELEDLHNKIGPKKNVRLPALKVVMSGPVWALFIANFANCYTEYTLESHLTSYLHGMLKLDTRKNPTINAIPFLACWLSTFVCAKLSDYFTKERCFTILAVRKLFAVVGIIGPALCTLAAVYMGCSRLFTIVLYIIAMFLKGAFVSGVLVNCNDLSRYHSGYIMGLINGIASTATIIGPWTVSRIVLTGTLAEWQSAFWITFGLCIMNSIIFLLFAKAERQPWDFTKEEQIDTK